MAKTSSSRRQSWQEQHAIMGQWAARMKQIEDMTKPRKHK